MPDWAIVLSVYISGLFGFVMGIVLSNHDRDEQESKK